MRVIWIVVTCLLLFAGAVTAQEPASSASAPRGAASAALPAPPASSPAIPALAVDPALRRDIAAILEITTRIATVQRDEGSLLLKVRDGFVTNTLWELFGFKSTEKTLAGYAISLLGILGLVLKAVWFVAKKGEPEPKWARALTYLYLVLVVSVFTLLASSGGVVSEVPASSAAARPLVEAGARLEAAADRLVRAHAEVTAWPAAPASSAAPAADPATAEALAALRRDLQAISTSAQAAARSAADAADKPTGWGWHLIIVVLLAGVLGLQVLTYAQSQER